jgi:hypothetical protein
MVATGRRIRLLRDDGAIVHGSEDDVVKQGGRGFEARYVYLDVVMKRGAEWQIVGSQLAKLARDLLTADRRRLIADSVLPVTPNKP